MTDAAVSFADHLEAFLGACESTRRYDWTDMPSVEVARFADQPMEGGVTYATVGLSEHGLREVDGGRPRRQELVLVAEDEREPYEAAYLLAIIATGTRDVGDALRSGQVVDVVDPLYDASPLEALLCLHPAYFPQEFDVFREPGADVPVSVVMLVGITMDEALFVRTQGIDAFVELLGDEDPNLFDWRRPPFLRWVETEEACPECGQALGHFHLPDGRAVTP